MFLCERISVSVQCDKIWEGPGDEANISSHNREVAAVWMWLQFGELIHLVLPFQFAQSHNQGMVQFDSSNTLC